MNSKVEKYQQLLPGIPLVESPFFDAFAEEAWQGEDLRIARDLNTKGYAVFDFMTDEVQAMVDGIKRDFKDKYDWQAWREGKLPSLRIQDAWTFDDRVRQIAANKRVLDLLTRLYGRRAFPFQTLNFPVGTQQSSHSDHVHFHSAPERFMCGVWLAMEDIDAENGPLFYYPGSHKWPTIGNEHIGVSGFNITGIYEQYNRFVDAWEEMARSLGIKRETFNAKAGQALIWSATLVHGGSPMLDKTRTRWSQVSHYFFDGCAYTTPVANDIYNGQIYYRDLIDVGTGKRAPNTVSGIPVKNTLIESLKPPFLNGGNKIPHDFDPVRYLALNPDVKAAGVDAEAHYLEYGRAEKRRY